MKTCLFCLILSVVGMPLLHAQIDFDHYRNLRCEGPIPEEFLTDLSELVSDAQEEVELEDDAYAEAMENAMYHIASSHHYFFNNGKILFGDPVTLYLNEVKDELLKNEPELAKKIQVYTFLSPIVNAFTTARGDIFVSVGLLSRFQSEAELAFVLSHEIVHYERNHTLNSVRNDVDMAAVKKVRQELSEDDRIRLKLQRSRGQEFEADSLGLLRFKRSAYSPESSLGVMSILGRSHLPVQDIPLDPEFFNRENFMIPQCFWIEGVAAIDPMEVYDDALQTHPSIERRRQMLANMLADDESKGEDAAVSATRFEQAREIASFELVDQLLLDRNYGEAFYTAYCLNILHPKSTYLGLALARSMYGLAQMKLHQRLAFSCRSYSDMQGESQGLYYLVKHLTSKQFGVLTLAQIQQAIYNYPEAEDLKLMRGKLVAELVWRYNINKDYFLYGTDAADYLDTWLAGYDHEAPSRQNRRAYNDFVKTALDGYMDQELKDLFLYYNAQPAPERSRVRLEGSIYDKEGLSYGFKVQNPDSSFQTGKILFIAPDVYMQGGDKEEDVARLELEENNQTSLVEGIQAIIATTSRQDEVFDRAQLTQDDVDQYNMYSEVKRWYTEMANRGSFLEVTTLRENALTAAQNVGVGYVVMVNIIQVGKRKFVYDFKCYDTQAGRLAYGRLVMLKTKKNLGVERVQREINFDYIQITQP